MARVNSRALTWIIIAGISLLALVIRVWYVVAADVLQPVYLPSVRGDAVDYYRYAWNLLHHGVFSMDVPGNAMSRPDGFRDPGYPVLFAIALAVFPAWPDAYAAMLLGQAVLGAATVGLLVFVLRDRLSAGILAFTGTVMAVWPHSVTAASFLLSEVATGFWLALGLAIISSFKENAAVGRPIVAGLALGCAALTNAVFTPFGVLVAIAASVSGAFIRRTAIALALAALALPLAWQVRNVTLPPGPAASDRAVMNFVQGSWRDYHAAYQAAMHGDPRGQQAIDTMNAEMTDIHASWSRGLGRVASRLGAQPMQSAAWYLGKPALLWQWDIRVGQGDVYTYPTRHSLFGEGGPLRLVWSVTRACNALVVVLALMGCTLVFLRERRSPGLVAAACLLVYATGIYSLLQAEPRYSVNLRGVEIAVAAVGALGLIGLVQRHRRRDQAKPSAGAK